jgi:acyl-ACP thioesterase
MPAGRRQSNFTEFEPLVPNPGIGRQFTVSQRVRVDAVARDGRLRFDGAARYVQDVAGDDSADSGLTLDVYWVARRTVIDVVRPVVFREVVDMTTFCSGMGRGWAERRISVAGDRGGRIEVATIWVALDRESNAPRRVPAGFEELYGESAQGRHIRPTLFHPGPSSEAVEQPWTFRAVDIDLLDHVNNAVYWVPLEERFAAEGHTPVVPCRGEAEYRQAIEPGDRIHVLADDHDDGFAHWFVDDEDRVKASVTWQPLPSDLYG